MSTPPSRVIVPPDPAWPAAFAREAQVLAAALHALPHEVHHIGSTAIAGMPAKPVIDMLLLVDDLAALDRHAGALVHAGYEAKGEFGIPQRRYFRKHSAAGVRTHHLHAFERGSTGAERHLAFRDYMNAEPAAAQAYAALKAELVARHPGDVDAYIAGKQAFVAAQEAAALAWVRSRSPSP